MQSLPVNDSPDDKFFNKYVREKVCAAGTNKWRDLGIVLMGQDAVAALGVIRTNYPNDVEECCSRMFTKWRQRTPNASWKHLIEGLREVSLTQLASELEKLLIPTEGYCVEQGSEIVRQHQLEKQLESEGIYLAVWNVPVDPKVYVISPVSNWVTVGNCTPCSIVTCINYQSSVTLNYQHYKELKIKLCHCCQCP